MRSFSTSSSHSIHLEVEVSHHIHSFPRGRLAKSSNSFQYLLLRLVAEPRINMDINHSCPHSKDSEVHTVHSPCLHNRMMSDTHSNATTLHDNEYTSSSWVGMWRSMDKMIRELSSQTSKITMTPMSLLNTNHFMPKDKTTKDSHFLLCTPLIVRNRLKKSLPIPRCNPERAS